MESGSTKQETKAGGEPVAPQNQAEPTKAESLGSRATRASVISLTSYIAAQVLRLCGNLILTRMLFEEAFGLMALVGVFLQGLQLFSDMGIGPNLIQSKRGEEPAFQDTAWTIQAGRGVLLWSLACIGAAPFATLYDAPQLRALLPVTAASALLAGLNSTKLFMLNRSLSMARLAAVELASQAMALVSMVAWAWFDRSVWALVSGAIAVNGTNMVLSHVMLPGRRNRFHWDRPSARELFRFGRWIFLSTALSFLAAQSDRLIFGKLISLRLLGVYNIAQMAAQMPATALGRLINTVVFPVLSRMFENGEDIDRTFRRVRYPLLLVGGYLISGFIAGGPVIIDLLYDERFHEAGWMLQLLSISGWFGVLEYSLMAGLLAAGRTAWIAGGAGARLAALIVMIPVGYSVGGFPLALLGFACTDAVRLFVSIIATRRLGIRSWPQDFWMSCIVGVAGYAGHLASEQTAMHVAPGFTGELMRAASVFGTVTLIWLPLAAGYFMKRRMGRGLPQSDPDRA